MLHALLSRFLYKEFRNAAAERRLDQFFEGSVGSGIWEPDQGEFPALLESDFAFIFGLAHSQHLWFVHEFSQPMPGFPLSGPPREILLGDFPRYFTSRGSFIAHDQSFLFTVDYDSHFTLFYGPRKFISDVTQELEIEGFFLNRHNTHDWWREGVPLPSDSV